MVGFGQARKTGEDTVSSFEQGIMWRGWEYWKGVVTCRF